MYTGDDDHFLGCPGSSRRDLNDGRDAALGGRGELVGDCANSAVCGVGHCVSKLI